MASVRLFIQSMPSPANYTTYFLRACLVLPPIQLIFTEHAHCPVLPPIQYISTEHAQSCHLHSLLSQSMPSPATYKVYFHRACPVLPPIQNIFTEHAQSCHLFSLFSQSMPSPATYTVQVIFTEHAQSCHLYSIIYAEYGHSGQSCHL
jgi:hypothetical protein